LFKDRYRGCLGAMTFIIVVSLLAAVGLTVVHLLSGKMRFLEGTPRSIWLNPPSQVAPVAALFRPTYPDVEALAQGVLMVGMLVGAFLTGLKGRRLFERAGKEPPMPSPAGVRRRLRGMGYRFAEL
jgi:hypothetical protein